MEEVTGQVDTKEEEKDVVCVGQGNSAAVKKGNAI